MSEWRNSSGKTLRDYPRPSLAVDVAVLTVADARLHVLVVESPHDGLALPGTFVHPNERTRDAADRALRTKAGVSDVEMHQLAIFDDPTRDYRGWVMSMAYGTAVARDRLPGNAFLVGVTDGEPDQSLAWDHARMVRLAVADLRARYADEVDPDNLIGHEFTVLELRHLYEAVYEHALPKDTFRRQVSDGLDSTGKVSSSAGGRPAELFRRRAGTYLPRSAAGVFEAHRIDVTR